METLDEFLEHHGIKGMKWGVRRADPSGGGSTHTTSVNNLKRAGGVSPSKTAGTATADANAANSFHTRAQTHGSASLSNAELQSLVTRMNLEQQYTRLSSQSARTNAGKKFAKEVLVNVAKQQVTKLANDQAAKQVAKLMVKAAL